MRGFSWWSPLFVLIAVAPSVAQAGRSARLVYQAPAVASEPGGPAVAVVVEDLRPPKKGGDKPALIGNERGSYGIPTAVMAGKGGTQEPASVVGLWATDCLRAAGYQARVGVDPSLPTLRIQLQTLWSEQIPMGVASRHETWITATVAVLPAGGTAPAWERQFSSNGGTTTVMLRFDDPVEAGFLRAFDEITRSFLGAVAGPEFQGALPGGNAESAVAAAETLGAKPTAGAATGGGAATEAAGPKVSGGPSTAAGTPPKPFNTWDMDVYTWGGRDTIGAFVFGGVAVGLLAAGDQWGRSVAATHYGVSDFGGLLRDGRHFTTTNGDPPVPPIAQAYVSEIFFDLGMQGVVPVFGSMVPSLVAATSGSDLRTVKAVTGLAAMPSLMVTGFAHLGRFQNNYATRLAALQGGAPEWLILAPSVISIASGVADIAVGAVQGVLGILYAAKVLEVDTTPGLMPPTQNRAGLQNVRAAWLLVPTADGGASIALVGTF